MKGEPPRPTFSTFSSACHPLKLVHRCECSHNVDKGTDEGTHGGNIHMDLHPHTHRGTHMNAHARVCRHRDTYTQETHPLPSRAPPGGTFSPSQLQPRQQQQGFQCSPHHPLGAGPRPSPCICDVLASLVLMYSIPSPRLAPVWITTALATKPPS